ncbi:MAG TPA: hypothetical protein VGJ91_01475, partial [Polyangiaceae bacterium]
MEAITTPRSADKDLGTRAARALSDATIRVNCAAMLELPDPGLYRTTQPLPGHEATFPAGVL